MTPGEVSLDEEDATPLIRIMVQPKWIAMLFVCLLIAAIFAALGQWQLSKAVASGHVVDEPTETVQSLSSTIRPNGPIRDAVTGQKVRFSATYVASDYQLLQGRLNYGKAGYWVVAHANTQARTGNTQTASLAVALGWAPDRASAVRAVDRLRQQTSGSVTVTGRVLPDEAPADPPNPDSDPYEMQTLSSAALYNLWSGGDGPVFQAYVISKNPPAGLSAIYSPPPLEQATLDWLNIFYAAEWGIFAVFAVYFWYRLVRDAKEREDQEREEAALAAAGLSPEGVPLADADTAHSDAPGSHPAARP